MVAAVEPSTLDTTNPLVLTARVVNEHLNDRLGSTGVDAQTGERARSDGNAPASPIVQAVVDGFPNGTEPALQDFR